MVRCTVCPAVETYTRPKINAELTKFPGDVARVDGEVVLELPDRHVLVEVPADLLLALGREIAPVSHGHVGHHRVHSHRVTAHGEPAVVLTLTLTKLLLGLTLTLGRELTLTLALELGVLALASLGLRLRRRLLRDRGAGKRGTCPVSKFAQVVNWHEGHKTVLLIALKTCANHRSN